ncbi:MAG: di-heme oxidoredictase family protein [Rhodospirillales bacterium]
MVLAALVVAAAAAPAPAAELSAAMGKALFERAWIPAPASTDATDGLGPLFSGRACAACHPGGGPARLRAAGGLVGGRGVVVRFGDAAGRPDPRYGAQLQEEAVPGLTPEGRLIPGGGRVVRLALNGPPPQPGIRAGLRLAPSLAGRGALERIDAAAVLSLADPDDRDGDGISGVARLIGSPEGGKPRLGRFGWKAASPDLRSQVASAFALDMGLSSTDAPLPFGDCTAAETDCLAAPTGIRPGGKGQEIDDQIIRLVTDFAAGRPLPAAAADPEAMRLLGRAGCVACHVPTLPDAAGTPVPVFTDLLLHDMGADLDDGVGEPDAASAEWRTAPLIDLGRRNGIRRYLHNGGAASIAAAIALHGGEAAASRRRFAALAAADRAKLLRLLEGM